MSGHKTFNTNKVNQTHLVTAYTLSLPTETDLLNALILGHMSGLPPPVAHTYDERPPLWVVWGKRKTMWMNPDMDMVLDDVILVANAAKYSCFVGEKIVGFK